MKTSRLGIFAIILIAVTVGGSCSFYNRVMSRKSLVDGARAYNERQFPEAQELFRQAVEYDPEGATFEGRTARLFLARTLHSAYAGNRKNTAQAEEAIKEYQAAMGGFVADLKQKREAVAADPGDEKARGELESAEKNVGSIVRSVASLFQNLNKDKEWEDWQTKQAQNADMPGDVRANAYVSLATKKYTCANDVTDSNDVKKTVKEGEESTFQFSKPADNEDFDKEYADAKQCVEAGMAFIDKAIELDPESDSAWSYKTSFLEQKARIAEIDGDNEKKEEFSKEREKAKKKFEELAEKRRKAEEAAIKAEAEAAEGKAEEEK